MKWIREFAETGIDAVGLVGGKNASLGEMIRELSALGVPVPNGFSVTAEAYRYYLAQNGLEAKIREILGALNHGVVQDLTEASSRIRGLMLEAELPEDLQAEIRSAYQKLSAEAGLEAAYLAVRSSATAEDLPNASFAGQQESFLMVRGDQELILAVRRSFASLFTARAINYREDMGFDHFQVGLSVGVQRMVRSDLASSGVIFTLDTESGFRGVVLVDAIYGFGENIVQGRVGPDEFFVHKELLEQGFKPLLLRKLGPKEQRLIYNSKTERLENLTVPPEERSRFAISEEEALTLARWAVLIEKHYSERRGTPTPMDIEWAKDGQTGELFILQARPETVHSQKKGKVLKQYSLQEKGEILVEGIPVGEAISTGKARVIRDVSRIQSFKPGEVLVTEITDPDWEPIMKTAAAIVTDRGGRTSHAAIVARELGVPAVVGCNDATQRIETGTPVTVSTVEEGAGKIYRGELSYQSSQIDLDSLPKTRTQINLNVGNPDQAFSLALLPADGVGLARIEFVFAGWVRVHPLALTRTETLPKALQDEIHELTAGYNSGAEFFVDRLAQGMAAIAGAFWPRPVILRFSDFKTNEYSHLLGGEFFEPKEENPMLGWRGASRYYHPDYREGFELELAALRKAREEMGLSNLKVMVPVCRSPEEGRRVLEVMKECGLERGKNGLEVYVMAELPVNIYQASEFAEIFDGFSIGSNDLTQMILGVDRDSNRVAPLYDERSPAVKRACAELIRAAHAAGRKVGICGQAPSDYPEFAQFLVEQGIDSISVNPDALVKTKIRVAEVEGQPA